jgi:hypothetical protein
LNAKKQPELIDAIAELKARGGRTRAAEEPQWLEEPTGEGWYWIEGGGPRYITKGRGRSAEKWWCKGAGGARPLKGRRVAPCTGRPGE